MLPALCPVRRPQSPTWGSPGSAEPPHTAPPGDSASGPAAQRSRVRREASRAPAPHAPRLPEPAPVPTAAHCVYGHRPLSDEGGGLLKPAHPQDMCSLPRHTCECAPCPCPGPGRWRTRADRQLPRSKPAHGPRGHGLVPGKPERVRGSPSPVRLPIPHPVGSPEGDRAGRQAYLCEGTDGPAHGLVGHTYKPHGYLLQA